MRHTIKLFQIGLRQILKDGMLLVLLPAPFFLGLVFKLGLPYVNMLFGNNLIVPWYGLADGVLICLSPILVAMTCAFLLLEERDEGISAFYQVTPTAGYSYLVARIGIPMLWAFISTVFAALAFHLSDLSFTSIVFSTIISSFMGAVLSMMIVSFAGNRVEGLAVSKFTGISLIGLLLVWVMPMPYQIIGGVLPSYWIGVLVNKGMNFFVFCFGMLSCLVWLSIFTKRFMQKIV